MKKTHAELDMDGTGPAVLTPLDRASQWLDDRYNPVFVKEVRQALRGKQFRSAFLFTVIISLIVGVSIVLGGADATQWRPIGPPFFVGVFSCLTIAVIGFVPMAAFSSMGAEWEENTFDMLILSRLRPRHIVHGKLLGAASQALLYFSIFTPYIVFTFLLGGVDLQLVLVSIPLLAVICFALTAFAVGLSSLTSKRAARVGSMIVLAAVLIGACFGLIGSMAGLTEMSIDLGSDDTKVLVPLIIVLSIVVAGFSIVIATSRLAHFEENRSSGLRVLTFVSAGMFMTWVTYANSIIVASEFCWLMTMMAIAGVTIVGIFVVSERESMGLRVKNQLPANRLLRTFLLPWLPGGGRGALWLLMTLFMVYMWGAMLSTGSPSGLAAIFTSAPVGVAHVNSGLDMISATVAYALLYLLLPTAVFSNRSNALQRTTLSRGLIPALFVSGLIVPPLLGFVIGDQNLSMGRHPGNPFSVFERIDNGSESGTLVIIMGFTALCLQFARILRGILEVVTAPSAGAMASPVTGVTIERVPSAEVEQSSEQDA